MAESAALSVAASILQVIDISVRVAERLNEYRKKEDSLPTAFKHVSTRLPIFILALQNTNAKMEDMTDEARRALKPAIDECFSQIKKLETIINKVLFKPGDRGATRGWKSIKSVRYDSDVSDLEKVIRRYMEAMDYGLSSMALNSGTEKSSPQPISTCPFEREADFVERDIMSDVMTRCTPGSRSALIGIGGAGKSRIAIEYSYRIREAAPDTWVFWVTFDTPAAVAQGFRKIAKAVGLRGWDEKAVDIFTMVQDWLKDESNGPWTLILDNVDSVDVLSAPASGVTSSISIDQASPLPQIRNFITTSTKGSVLVTSRNAEAAQMITGNCAYHIEVDEMNEPEAIALLKKKLSIKVIYTEAEAAELVKSVVFMPLAISQIAKNINMDYPRLTLSKATERIKALSEETAQLLEESAYETSRDANKTNSIVKTWHLSFEYVRQTYPSAARLISLMCLFDRQSIPETLLTGQYGEVTASAPSLQPRLDWWKRIRRLRLDSSRRQRVAQQRATGSKPGTSACFDEDWRVLKNFALIKTNIDGCHFSMHRLVQYTTKRWLEINGELKAWMQRYISIIRDHFPNPEHDNWQVCQYLFPHAQQVARYRLEDRAMLLTWAPIIQKMSQFAYVIGDHHSAEDLGRAALAALEVVKGPHFEDTLRSYHQLGLAIGGLNRHNESEKMFRRAYEGRQALLGFHHSDTLESANQLGAQLIMQKKYEEGEAMHMRTIEGYERVYGPRSAETTILLAILTFTYLAHERFEQATVMHRKVLAIQKRDDGEEADDAYEGLRCLGILLIRQGKAAEAETIHRQVVEDTTSRLGLYHSEIITSVNFLCEALVKQRKLDEAVAQYRSVTDIYTDLDNEEAQQKALLAMNGLAETLVQQGHFEQAEAVCRRFVLESERLLGADHCNILIGVRTLADTLTKQERYQEALVLYERAYIGIEKCCGADSPDTKLFLDDFNNAKRNI